MQWVCDIGHRYEADDPASHCPYCDKEEKDAELGAFVREWRDWLGMGPTEKHEVCTRIRDFIAQQEQP